MRFFSTQNSIVKALPLFLPMVDRSKNDMPLGFNLEIINAALHGNLDPNQPDFQLDAYTARCEMNAKKSEIAALKKTTFLIEGNQFNEYVTESKKKGGVSEEALSFKSTEAENEDPFSLKELEQELTLKSLVNFHKQFLKKGISLLMVLQGIQDNNPKSLELLRSLSKDNPDFEECLMIALESWSGEGLLPKLEQVLKEK